MKVIPRSSKAVRMVDDNTKISGCFLSKILLEMRAPNNTPVKYALIIQAEISGFKPI